MKGETNMAINIGYARPFSSTNNPTIYDTHIHSSYEFYFMDDDNIDITYEDTHVVASLGDIYIFPPFKFHMINAKGKSFKRHVSHFDEENIKVHSQCALPIVNYIAQFSPFYVRLNSEQCETLREMIKKQTEYEQTPDEFQYFNSVFAFCSILKYVAEIHMQNGNQKPNFTKSDDNTFPKMLKFLHNNFTDDISADMLIKKFKIGKTTLYRLFTEYIGISFKEYLIRLRITKSMMFLEKGLSVTEAANLSGFNSYAHFIRTFTDRVGVSPKQYALRKPKTETTDYLLYLSN